MFGLHIAKFVNSGDQQAATEVYQDLMMSGAAVTTLSAGRPGRPRGLEQSSRAGGRGGSRGTTTDLRDGWMASPLLGQAFHPEALDRCPRGILQVMHAHCGGTFTGSISCWLSWLGAGITQHLHRPDGFCINWVLTVYRPTAYTKTEHSYPADRPQNARTAAG